MPSPHLLMELDARNNAGKKVTQLEGQVEKLRHELRRLGVTSKSQERANQRLKRSFSDMHKSAKRARRGFGKMKAAVVGLGAVFAGGIMVEGIKDASAFQAKLNSLGPDIDATRQRLLELQKLTGHTFSLDALVRAESMIRAFGLQDELKLTPKLLDVITSKAAKMGKTTDEAMNSMIVALARSSSKWLDNLGIIVKGRAANEAYKKSLGDVNMKLTDQQKTIAFVRAALKKMNEDTGEVSESYKVAAQMSAKLDDAVMALKETLVPLAPMLVTAIEGFAQLVVGIGHFTNAMLQAFDLQDTETERAIKETGAHEITIEQIGTRALLERELHRRGIANIEEFHGLNIKVQRSIQRAAADTSYLKTDTYMSENRLSKANHRRIVLQLGKEARDRQVHHADRLKQIKEDRDAQAAASSWFGMEVGGAGGGTKPPKAIGPTRAERKLNLEILDLQLLKVQALSGAEKMYIQHQIQQLELQKERVDRQRDANGVLEAKQVLLDATQVAEITTAETKKQLDDDEASRKDSAAKAEVINKRAAHALDLQIADVETRLAGARTDEHRIALERQIADLEIQKERIGATKEEIQLIEKKIEALKAGRSVEDQEREASAMESFAEGLSSASQNMSAMSPGLAELTKQMVAISTVMGNTESTAGDVATATIKGVGTAAAAFVDGEQEKATIMSLMEFAQAAANWWNPPAAIAHTIAGGMFAGIAAGAGGGGGAAKKPVARPGGGGGGGGGSVTVNFGSGIVLGTPQDVGRAVYQATGSVEKTGMQSGAV